MSKSIKGAQTEKNLLTAFADESQARNRYTFFASTARKEGYEQIANTVFQITSVPPTLAVSINQKNLTHEYIKASGVFAVSTISQDAPLSFIGQFDFKSGRDVDKLSGINLR